MLARMEREISMALFSYFKSEPTEYILAYVNGHVVRRGAGLSFWYWAPHTSISLVPISTVDAPFIFNETTNNFQAVTVQGQVTFRIVAPETMAQLLNFTVQPRTRRYQSEDPVKLQQRIVNIVQMHTRNQLQQLSLEDALRSSESLARNVLTRLREGNELAALGIECMSLFYTALKATPEMTKALEAEQREALQRRADQAIYSRRAEAVEQERKIKQNELATSVVLEERRKELVNLQGENTRQEAEYEAMAMRIRLAPYSELEVKQLLALSFHDFADNAHKIGNLTITSEILEQLLHGQ
ncbi:band 7 protein [Ktedonobacter racemifer DSM 44963]|uniref:Band 7 protein n=2 Tax=Ktedonobacter racemifer TaxID=363277 RepID=D6TR19_KTERA|nr:band 7 protein [Ktedonobacter racemifer DSM 44963]